MKKKMLLLGALASLAAVTVSTIAQTTVAYAETESSKLTQAKQAVSQAQEQVNQAKSQLDSAKRSLADIQGTYDQAKQSLVVAQDNLNAYPTITLTNEYISALKDYAKGDVTSNRYKQAEAKLEALSPDLYYAHDYVPNPSDNYQVDVNNLTMDQLKQLTMYATALVNSVRSQLGTIPVDISNGAIQFADTITDGYVLDNWSGDDGHYNEWINSSASRLGLESGTGSSSQMYEDAYISSEGSSTMSMSEAKRNVYEAMLMFMFNQYEWGHASDVAGLRGRGKESFGVDLSNRGFWLNVHYITVPDSYIKAGSTFDRTVIPNTYTENNLTQAYNSALANLNNVELTYQQRKQAVNQAQAQLDNAKNALQNAQNALQNAQNAQNSQSASKPSASNKPSSSKGGYSTGKTTPSSNGLKSVYRMYHPSLKVHLYTSDPNEYKVLSARGWLQEGESWKTETTKGQPVYRMYHPSLKVHLYTKDTNEYKVLAKRGWLQEGVAYRSFGSVKVYRMYHIGLKKHLYTKDPNEYKVLAKRGWKQEGVAWYSK